MTIRDTVVPRFEVEAGIRHQVKDVTFDGVKYSEYVLGRGVSEERLSRLKLKLGSRDYGRNTIALYAPSRRAPSIEFFAGRMNLQPFKQNRILLHETEHFIFHGEHPASAYTKPLLGAGVSLLAGCIAGTSVARLTLQSTENMPVPVRIASAGVALVGAGLPASFFAADFYLRAFDEFSPDEINARRAEAGVGRMSDDLLRIEFRNPVPAF